jgi:hypothetical protein
MHTDVVQMPLHPPTRNSGGQVAAPLPISGAQQKASAEGMSQQLAPIQTEDEKTNYTAASTPTLNDLTPSGSSGLTTIKLSDVAIQGTAFVDAGNWKIRVTSASTTIHWGITTGGYQIPNPVDGGNITQANWQTVVTELQGYEARQASGSWHHPDASRTHELNHVSWFRGEILRTWPAIETAIQAHVLGADPAMNQAQADAAMQTFLDQKRRDWFNAYGVAPEPPAYRAGQGVLNGIITQIEAYATTKGWK